jgi:hypothetical protein
MPSTDAISNGYLFNHSDISPSSKALDRFRMMVIKEGTYTHPTEGFSLPVDRQRMQRWVDAFPAVKKHSGVFLPSRHSRKPEDNRGWVENLEIVDGPDGSAELWIEANVTHQETAEGLRNGSIRGSSICVNPNTRLSSSDGKIIDVGEAIEHVALTLVPVVGEQPGPLFIGDNQSVRYWPLDRTGTLSLQRQTVGKNPPQDVIEGKAKVSKDDANYRLGEAGQRCGTCLFYTTSASISVGNCSIVDGEVYPDRLSDYYKPRERYLARHNDDDDDDDDEPELFRKKKKEKKKMADDALEFQRKLDPKAKKRNRPNPVFPHTSPRVKDNADHFPIDTPGRARNALARANQYSRAPSWYSGTLASLKRAVVNAVHKRYPSIKISARSLDQNGQDDSKDEVKEMAISNEDLAKLAEAIGYEDVLPDNPDELADELQEHFSKLSADKTPAKEKEVVKFELESHPKYLELKGQYDQLLHWKSEMEQERLRERSRALARQKADQHKRMLEAVKKGKTTEARFKSILSDIYGLSGDYKFELSADRPIDAQERETGEFEKALRTVEQNADGAIWPGVAELTKHEPGEDDAIKAELDRRRTAIKEEDKDREDAIKALFERTGNKRFYVSAQ